MSDLIKVLVVDDHPIVRRGLATLLIARHGIQVVGEAATGEEAIAKARHLRVDVILMDLKMPRLGGLAAIHAIRAEDPTARILVLTNFDEYDQITAAIQAGALGYIRKDTSADELFEAIHTVAKGVSYLPQELVQKLVLGLRDLPPVPTLPTLSARELDILDAIAKGMANREIAAFLMITTATVRSHVSNIMSKLGVSNRTAAAVYGRQNGLLRE